MAIDVEKLIADATAARANAEATALAAQKIADQNKADTEKANNVKSEAATKFDYAKALKKTINDFEGQISTYITKISRGDKLDSTQQKDFDRIVSEYKKVDANYQKTIAEGNKILEKMPKSKAETTKAVKEDSGQATPEETEIQPEVKITEFINTLADPKNVNILKQVQADLAKFGWTGGVTGQYTIPFQAALIKVYQNRGQLPKNLQGTDLRTFIATADPALIGVAAGGPSGPAPVVPQTTISNETQAAVYVNNVIKSLTGRDATPEEISTLTKKLNAAEAKNPVKTVNGKTTGGINREQFLTDLIKTGPKFKGIAAEIANLKESKITSTESLLAKTAAANGLTLSVFADADSWVNRINQGESIENFKQIIRNTASRGLPDNIKKLLGEGVDLDAVYSPYKQTMAAILEINPDSISLNDPTLRMGIGADKEMPLYEYQKALRQDTRWQYTNNAKEDVSSSVQKVLRDFGFMG
jgi:hypothetical protein